MWPETDVFSFMATNLTGREKDDSPTGVEEEGEVAMGLNGGEEDDSPTGMQEEDEVTMGLTGGEEYGDLGLGDLLSRGGGLVGGEATPARRN
jgi:hypothetical protein